jgi:predicted PurR-regulated permease PerM
MLLEASGDVQNTIGNLESLSQYGALGVVAAIMGSALWVLLKRIIKSEDELKKKVDNLQEKMNDYIQNDQNRLKEVIDNNSKAMTSLRDTVLELKIVQENKK